MREVGDRFQNMYFAAQGGNWALASYMSKYMNGAMTPAKVTKPAEYKTWASFYGGAWQPVEKAINAKDIKAFDKAYKDVVVRLQWVPSSNGLWLHRGNAPEGAGRPWPRTTRSRRSLATCQPDANAIRLGGLMKTSLATAIWTVSLSAHAQMMNDGVWGSS